MAEEDNFDIDIYGDGGEDYQQETAEEDIKVENPAEQASGIAGTNSHPQDTADPPAYPAANGHDAHQEPKLENGHMQNSDVAQKIASTDDSTQDPVQLPKQAPQTQGLKRKDGTDDRFVDLGATTALFISELHWWVTDDDIRGWANQRQCEDELEDITFSEHKVNGKSKGCVSFQASARSLQANHHRIDCGLDKLMFSSNLHKLLLPPSKRLSPLAKANSIQRSSPSAIPILLPILFEHFPKTGLCGITILRTTTVQQVAVMAQGA